MDYKSKIILIAGPTASGKSKIAINLAKKINGEIINKIVINYRKMVPSTGFEPVTSSLPMTRSTAGAMTALFKFII